MNGKQAAASSLAHFPRCRSPRPPITTSRRRPTPSPSSFTHCFWQLHLAQFGILFWPTLCRGRDAHR